jgi:cytochrome oxidase assembly protein ShyY1
VSSTFDTSILRRPRWIAAIVVALLVVVGCLRLGVWQLDRLEERRARNAQIDQRSQETPRPLTSLRAEFNDLPSDLAYRTAVVEGVYRADDEFVAVGRVYGDLKGKLVATPLELADGSVLIVVRGIVPGDTSGPPMEGFETPSGRVTIEGRLSVGEEPSRISEPEPQDGHLASLSRLDLDYIDEWIDGDVLPFALLLDEQRPSGPGDNPAPIPNEELTEGSHLGYAIQWFAFAIIAFAGGIGLILRAGRRISVDPSEGLL